MRVGIVGCGFISRQYARNAAAFDSFVVTRCADADVSAARVLAAEHGYRASSVEALLADPDVDLVLNLTPPGAHGAVVRAALAAGKHVYTEKPLATTAAEAAELVEEAERRGLRLGSAPDVFLAGPYQAARTLLDAGEIGEPLAVSAAMLVGGQAAWHPNPDIFFADGAGPLLDMGPYYLTAIVALLGPVRRVAGVASTRVAERVIEVGPRAGTPFAAATPTHTSATLQLEGDVTVSLLASFDAPGQYVYDLAVYGTEGTLLLPDPNAFGGPLLIRHDRGQSWQPVRLPGPSPRDGRGLGLHDLVTAHAAGEPHRACGRLALHVVDVARAILGAAEAGRTLDVATGVPRPAPRPEAPAVSALRPAPRRSRRHRR